MYWKEYCEETGRTWDDHGLDAALMGCIGESGEIAGLFKKTQFYGKSFQEMDFVLEAGDLCYYIARVSIELGFEAEVERNLGGDISAIVPHVPQRDDKGYVFAMSSCILLLADNCSQACLECASGRYESAPLLFARCLVLASRVARMPLVEIFERNIRKLEERHQDGFDRSYYKETA